MQTLTNSLNYFSGAEEREEILVRYATGIYPDSYQEVVKKKGEPGFYAFKKIHENLVEEYKREHAYTERETFSIK